MPKKAKKGKGKGKGKKKKKTGPPIDVPRVLKELLAEYDTRCEETSTAVSVAIKKVLLRSIESEKIITKFIFDPKDRLDVDYWDSENLGDYLPIISGDVQEGGIQTQERPKTSVGAKKGGKKMDKEELRWLRIEKRLHEANIGKRLMRLEPFVEAIRNKRYLHINSLFVWEMALTHEDVLALMGLLNRGCYPIKILELMDCFLQPHTVARFAPSVNLCRTLKELTLDFNEFGDKGCKGLCDGLFTNKTLNHLSLCYCDFTKESGIYLGDLVARTAIRELLLDGNELEAEGTIALIQCLADFAEVEARVREEEVLRKKAAKELKALEAEKAKSARFESGGEGDTLVSEEESEKQGKKGGKKKKKGKKKKGKKGKKGKRAKSATGIPINAVLSKLHLADNGIDSFGRGSNFAPIRCMQLCQTLLANSHDLAEIDLWGNNIGDLGARLLLEGLKERSEAKLPGVAVRVSYRTVSETFNGIAKLAGSVKKKKLKKKGGKKKKKK